jgi:hypothetical protein
LNFFWTVDVSREFFFPREQHLTKAHASYYGAACAPPPGVGKGTVEHTCPHPRGTSAPSSHSAKALGRRGTWAPVVIRVRARWLLAGRGGDGSARRGGHAPRRQGRGQSGERLPRGRDGHRLHANPRSQGTGVQVSGLVLSTREPLQSDSDLYRQPSREQYLVGVGMRCMLQRCDFPLARAYAIGLYIDDSFVALGIYRSRYRTPATASAMS